MYENGGGPFVLCWAAIHWRVDFTSWWATAFEAVAHSIVWPLDDSLINNFLESKGGAALIGYALKHGGNDPALAMGEALVWLAQRAQRRGMAWTSWICKEAGSSCRYPIGT